MKTKTIFSAVMTLCLMTGASAFAQNRDNYNAANRGDNRGQQGQQQRPSDLYQNNGQGRNDHADGRGRNDRADYRGRDNANGQRGAGPRHDLRRGQRISQEYRGKQYVVNDWRGHRLSAPPRGQQWVQTGGDYVLVSIATGIIAQILLNN